MRKQIDEGPQPRDRLNSYRSTLDCALALGRSESQAPSLSELDIRFVDNTH